MRAIVCADKCWGIGKDGALQVRISTDLKRFKSLTMGCPVILGRKTLATFPEGKPLPGRPNFVLSKDPHFCPDGVTVFRDIDSLLAVAGSDAWVIGGGEVYRQLLPYCTRIYVTRLDVTRPADAFFPDLDAETGWERVEREGPYHDGDVTFWYDTYERR